MSGRRALVTGASRGIGRAIAVRLAADGWDVAVHFGVDRQSAESLMQELGERCSGVYKADLANHADASRLMESVLADGPLYAVVNNAGVYLQNSFVESGDEEFEATMRRTLAINLESPIRICRAAAKYFVGKGEGKILNIASRVGFKGEAGAALYAASKAALINLTRSLAVELAPKNVQLFGLAPGWVNTSMARSGMEDRLPSILKDIPMGRMATPQDCAAAAAFLFSEEASYLSGVVIDINGASYFH